MKPYWENKQYGLSMYLGNCLEVIPAIDRYYDFCVTSPPYALGKEYEPGVGWRELKTLIAMLAHVMLPYFVSSKFCVINFGETTTYRKTMAELYNDAFQDAGWIMHSRRIWKKDFASTSLGPSDINLSVPVAEWEYLWSFRKPPSKKEVFRNRNLTRRGVWDSTGYKKVSGTHPAAFPIWLPLTCMDAWTGINELVVDPFLGSGTTMEACYQAGRRCVGIEQSEEYAEKAAKRMETIVNQQRLFEPRVLKSDKPKQHRLTV